MIVERLAFRTLHLSGKSAAVAVVNLKQIPFSVDSLFLVLRSWQRSQNSCGLLRFFLLGPPRVLFVPVGCVATDLYSTGKGAENVRNPLWLALISEVRPPQIEVL